MRPLFLAGLLEQHDEASVPFSLSARYLSPQADTSPKPSRWYCYT